MIVNDFYYYYRIAFDSEYQSVRLIQIACPLPLSIASKLMIMPPRSLEYSDITC